MRATDSNSKPTISVNSQDADISNVSKRVFCFLYSDGNEVYNKSSLSETRTEARKTIEDKYPKLFLLRDEQSYENVC